MTRKNNQILKGIIFNSFLFIALAEGNSSEFNKEDFDKQGYRPQHEAIEEIIDQEYNLIGVALFSGKGLVSNAIHKLTDSMFPT